METQAPLPRSPFTAAEGKARLDIVVLDAEILRCIPDRNAPRDPALEYCDGWNDHANMGISVICAIDTRTYEPRIFLQDNLAELARLIDGRVVAGFNNIGFDHKLMEANGLPLSQHVEHYDLCVEVRRAVAEPDFYTPGKTRGGRKLDDLARVNLGMQKPMSGALAPIAWQRGNYGEVIDYCMGDVQKTLALIEMTPNLLDPVTQTMMTVRRPGT
jgi:hypothetical protein